MTLSQQNYSSCLRAVLDDVFLSETGLWAPPKYLAFMDLYLIIYRIYITNYTLFVCRRPNAVSINIIFNSSPDACPFTGESQEPEDGTLYNSFHQSSQKNPLKNT